MTAALILTSASHTIACASCNAPWPLAVAQCPGCGRIAVASITAQVVAPSPDDLRAQLAAVTAERDASVRDLNALRVVVAGRAAPPTNAEIDAHCTTGGRWRWASHADLADMLDADRAKEWARGMDHWRRYPLWWAVDANGRPCPWPTVPA